MRFFNSHIETRFFFLFALMASLFILPQTSQANETSICPSGVKLYKLAQQNIGRDENPSIATLLWLNRGDAMWSDHPYDNDMVRKKIWGITYNYEVGSQGYPKSKKTSKWLNKYREAHRDARPRIISGSGPVLVRPKGVPAAPPASAIALAEENLKCRYLPNVDPNERAKKVAERQVCLLEDGAMADKILGPAGYHRNLKKDELAHIDKAAAVLMWKHGGSKALTEPDEDGVDRTGNRKVDIWNLAVRGYNSILYPRPDIVAAFKANRKDGSVSPLLSGPPLNMVEWAEDYLDCRYDGNSWDSAAASREAERQEIARKKEQERQEWIANAPQRERLCSNRCVQEIRGLQYSSSRC